LACRFSWSPNDMVGMAPPGETMKVPLNVDPYWRVGDRWLQSGHRWTRGQRTIVG